MKFKIKKNCLWKTAKNPHLYLTFVNQHALWALPKPCRTVDVLNGARCHITNPKNIKQLSNNTKTNHPIILC